MAGALVALLHERFGDGARPDELDALVQAEEVSTVLQALGYRVERLAVDMNLAALQAKLEALRPGFVFNLVESLGGSGALIATVPAMLAAMDLPVTGCGANALYLSSHKTLAKHWLRRHGLATPDWIEGRVPDVANGRWIIKSVWEHASLGLDDACVVSGSVAIRQRMQESRADYGGDWFAERYIDGREFNISVIELDGQPQVLPLAEIEFDGYAPDKPRIVGYAAKWQPEAVEYHATRRVFPSLPEALARQIRELAEACWSVFRLSGYARVDLRIDAAGIPWILEINANPCLARDAGFCAAAAAAGMEYESLIRNILAAAGRSH